MMHQVLVEPCLLYDGPENNHGYNYRMVTNFRMVPSLVSSPYNRNQSSDASITGGILILYDDPENNHGYN